MNGRGSMGKGNGKWPEFEKVGKCITWDPRNVLDEGGIFSVEEEGSL